MIKYLGSKKTLLPAIEEVVRGLEGSESVIDLFSGTSRVGHHLKKCGYKVHSNDLNTYAYTLASCYVVADKEETEAIVRPLIKQMNQIKAKEGYFTKTFCEDSLFFQPKNGEKIDAIREWIETQNFSWEIKSILLVSLMEAADRVDSTCGIQMAYLKNWSARSHNDLELRIPALVSRPKAGKCSATHMDAIVAASKLSGDIAYLDPPYNQHKYLGNYHIWESLVRWDKPEVYGKARKRIDVRERKSTFNQKKKICDAMQKMVDSLDVSHIIVSFNNEGYISQEEMTEILSSRGDVLCISKDYKRYVGAQIGIHDRKGQKVGAVSHLQNKEFIFLVSDPSKMNQSVKLIDSLKK